MALQSLSPGMQNTEEADLRAEARGIGCNFQQRSRAGFEQQAEEEFLVLPDQWYQSMRHAEDQVEIARRQKLPPPGAQPFLPCVGLAFWAMAISTCNGEISITCLMGSIF
jgi:hypothetical protein